MIISYKDFPLRFSDYKISVAENPFVFWVRRIDDAPHRDRSGIPPSSNSPSRDISEAVEPKVGFLGCRGSGRMPDCISVVFSGKISTSVPSPQLELEAYSLRHTDSAKKI